MAELLDAAPRGKSCAFCGVREKLHKEHVWAVWTSKLFRPTDKAIRHLRTFQRPGADIEQLVWPARPFEQRVSAPCQRCNNGWMSDLETKAEPILAPIIKGQSRRLGIAAQATVATWAVKTVMMAAYTHPETRVIPPSDYGWLRRHGSPPPRFQVWIGARAQGVGDWPTLYRHLALGLVPAEQAPFVIGLKPNAHRTTLAIGHLVLHVAGFSVPRFALNLEVLKRSVIPIWPHPGRPVLWPPEFAVNDVILDGMTQGESEAA
jgi:hypothetical protein